MIEVYDAGQGDAGVFLAMELLDGVTLRDWAKTAEPPWQRVIEVYQAAGRGLAAAHAAGLVHRDFKPANVMLTTEHRVVVLDFGLVQADGAAEQRFVSQPGAAPTSTTSTTSTTEATAGEQRLTQTGFVLGTPAYMAPEQAHGGSITAHCDQFAFCVALYEALYGHRPFAGSDTAARVQACERAELQRPPAETPVPARVEQILARGLSHDPERRWPSMATLLDALRSAIDRPRRGRIAGALLGIAVLGLAATASLRPNTLPNQDATRRSRLPSRPSSGSGSEATIHSTASASSPPAPDSRSGRRTGLARISAGAPATMRRLGRVRVSPRDASASLRSSTSSPSQTSAR